MSRSACAIGKDVVPASFKGVPFYCTEADIEGGRRGAEGEFPFGENTAYADLGRKIRIYKLSAVFRADDHVWDSHALFLACESPGPGILVHPTRGAVMVACRSVSVKDQLEDSAGETTAEMEFVEANVGFSGILGSIFGIISTGLLAASQTTFLNDYTPIQVAHPWRVDVVDKAQSLVAATATAATYTLVSDSPVTDWHEVLDMQAVVKDDGLALSAKNVDNAMTDGFALISRNLVDPNAKFNVFRKLVNVALTAEGLPAGPAVETDEAVVSRHRLLAAVGMAEAAMGRKYPTMQDCLAARETVMAVFDDEAKIAYGECDNKLYLEIVKYSTEFSKMMYDLSYRLPGQVIVNFSGGVHPLVAAYAIYKDAKRHRELEERNIIDANGRFGMLVSGIAPT
jgi:DNA circularisation protein N-terminus